MALIDSGERDHERCVAELKSLTSPLVTNWPVFTEAMYLLGDAGGWAAQKALWLLASRGDLELVDLSAAFTKRSQILMEKYKDRPMSLADAALLAIAEDRGYKRVFSLDSNFDIYRIKGRERLTRVPS